MRRKQVSPGFTLIELLVVVSIIGILVMLLMPTLGRVREQARRAVCATNLHALGTGWRMYFAEFNGKVPPLHNWSPGSERLSQLCFRIYTNASPNEYCNAGLLYKLKMISSERVFVCPTIQHFSSLASPGGAWFHETRGSYYNQWHNPWPPRPGSSTHMTYSTRRMRNYDRRSLAIAGPPEDDGYLLRTCGIKKVREPGSFSFMTDSFHGPGIALLSHVPGINVLNLGGGVHYWKDPTADGAVLYDNGMTGCCRSENNPIHDDIWMVIDGYHDSPPDTDWQQP